MFSSEVLGLEGVCQVLLWTVKLHETFPILTVCWFDLSTKEQSQCATIGLFCFVLFFIIWFWRFHFDK